MAGAHFEPVPALPAVASAAAPVTAPTTVASAIVSLAIPGAARWHYDVIALPPDLEVIATDLAR